MDPYKILQAHVVRTPAARPRRPAFDLSHIIDSHLTPVAVRIEWFNNNNNNNNNNDLYSKVTAKDS